MIVAEACKCESWFVEADLHWLLTCHEKSIEKRERERERGRIGSTPCRGRRARKPKQIPTLPVLSVSIFNDQTHFCFRKNDKKATFSHLADALIQSNLQ